MIDSADIVTFIGFGIGSFGIGFAAGFILLTFKRAAGVLSK